MYTLELYKTDARTKSGERLVEKRDGCGAMGSASYPVNYTTPRCILHPSGVWRYTRQWSPSAI